MPVALDILTRKYILFKKTGYTLCAHCICNGMIERLNDASYRVYNNNNRNECCQ
jgi:hypothetical protein